ncbi:MAG: aminotransferase class V-fold PLP-dependent enzyme [Caldilineae bacterium]|nr:MAG: aminotransferase class V-fold PLP-dependent enzyme [Caldilineae bacterium]
MLNPTPERIRQLQSQAQALEPGADERRALLDAVARHAELFWEQFSEQPTFYHPPDIGKGLYEAPIGEEPDDLARTLSLLLEQVDRSGLNTTSGGYMGYIPGGGLYHAALGDFLAAISNRYVGIYFGSPGAVRMENMLIRWLAQEVGYPDTMAGVFTSGGSMANLVGIVTAREAHGLRARDVERAPVYLSAQTHHSVRKALRLAGLGECPVRYVPLDDGYRMRADALDQAIRADEAAGLRPWLVIATAGATDTGAVDPLADIAEIARRHGLWLHVDGAYGAAFALTSAGKKILRGLEASDSFVMDPHKGLFLPYGSGAILVREGQRLRQAHTYEAHYMQDAQGDFDEMSPADLSPELSRHFRGLRLWLPLKLVGVAPFRAALEEKMLLARYFYQRLQEVPGFELGPYPDLSLVTFRYRPARGDVNEFNRRLVQTIQQDGRIFLSSTMLDGRFTIRLVVLHYRTHLDTIEQALTILRETAYKLERGE